MLCMKIHDDSFKDRGPGRGNIYSKLHLKSEKHKQCKKGIKDQLDKTGRKIKKEAALSV